MPDQVRERMEGRFSHDFSDVRVHTDSSSGRQAEALQARAYTHGHDIHFGEGRFAAESADGEGLLRHELTHVVQHDEGRLPSTGVSMPDDPVEQEAYAVEGRVPPRRLEPEEGAGGKNVERLLPSGESPVPSASEETVLHSEAAPPERATATAATGPRENGMVPRPDSVRPSVMEPPGVAAVAAEGGPRPVISPPPTTLARVPAADLLSLDLSTVGPNPEELDQERAASGAALVPVTGEQAAGYGGRLRAYGETLAGDVESLGSGALQSLAGEVARMNAELSAAAAQAHAAIESAFSERIAAVQAAGDGARTSVEASAARQVDLLTVQAEKQRGAIREHIASASSEALAQSESTNAGLQQLGESEAARSLAESEQRVSRATAMGDQAASRSSGDVPRAGAQTTIASRVSGRAAEGCTETGRQLADQSRATAAAFGGEVDRQVESYLTSLRQGEAEALGQVDTLLSHAVVQVQGTAAEGVRGIDALVAQSAASLVGERDQLLAQVDALTEQGGLRLRTAHEQLVQEFMPVISQSAAALRQYGNAALERFTALDGADAAALAEAVAVANTEMEQLHARTSEGVSGFQSQTIAELEHIPEEHGQTLDRLVSQAAAAVDAAVNEITARIRQAETGASTQLEEIAADAKQAMALGTDAVSAEVDKGAQSLREGLLGLQDEAAIQLTTAVDKGLAEEDGFVEKAGGEIDRGQASIGSRYDSLKGEAESRSRGGESIQRSWLGDAWDSVTDWASRIVDSVRKWFLDTFGEFWGGLLFGILEGLAIVALAAVAVWAIGAVVGFFIVSAKVAAIVTLVIVLAAGIGLGIWARFSQFEADHGGQGPSFWQGVALVGLGIADLTGIPFIVEAAVGQRAFAPERMSTSERGERLGMGIVFLGAAIFGGIRLWKGKGPGAGRPGEAEPAPRAPGEPEPPPKEVPKEVPPKEPPKEEPPKKVPPKEAPNVRVVRVGDEITIYDATTGELIGMGQLDATGYLNLAIYTKGKNTTVRGSEVFEAILNKFLSDGTPVRGIRGLWYAEDNLATFNDLIRQGLTPEEAASQTFTGKMATRKGYPNVRVDYAKSPRNPDGTFQKAEIWFDP